jgi:hypothetical protein
MQFSDPAFHRVRRFPLALPLGFFDSTACKAVCHNGTPYNLDSRFHRVSSRLFDR